MSDGIKNNCKADHYADNSNPKFKQAFDFGANKPVNGVGKAGAPQTTDRQDNGEIGANPKTSEMHRRGIPGGTGNRPS